MKCLYCKKDTYYEPFAKFLGKKDVKFHRCTTCNAQFSVVNDNTLFHKAFFVDIKDNTYYINQYLPNSENSGKTTVSLNGERVLVIDFIENLSPSNVEKKLRFWLTFS